MIAFAPNPVPAEPGCCVVRVKVPETPFEHLHPVNWRVTLWTEGRCYTCGVAADEPPTLAACLSSFRALPICWPEVLRA